jgi:hypothetical protein
MIIQFFRNDFFLCDFLLIFELTLATGAKMIRKLLSIERSPPIEQVLAQPGVLHCLVALLGDGAPDSVHYEAS